jgi:hypothetical protein
VEKFCQLVLCFCVLNPFTQKAEPVLTLFLVAVASLPVLAQAATKEGSCPL